MINLISNIKNDIKKIINVENNFNNHEFLVNDINIWPLIRLELFKFQEGNILNKKDKIKNKNKQNILRLFIRIIIESYKFRKKIKLIGEKKFENIFLSNKKFYYDKYNNKIINNLIDPYFHFFKNNNKIKIEINSPFFFKGKRKFFSPLDYNFATFDVLSYLLNKYNFFQIYRDTKILKIKLNHIENKYKIDVNHQNIIKNYLQIKLQSKLLTKFLKKIKPKCVFLSCYYSIENFSIILACKKLKITTKDIQHGGIDRFHYMYSNWKYENIIKNNLVPDHYLIWNKEYISRYTLPNSFSKNFSQTGKLSINFWIKNKNKSYEYNDKKNIIFKKKLKKYKKIILFCVTDEIPNILIKLIKETSKDYFWLIRMHPRHSEKKIIKKQLKHLTLNKNFDIEFSSKLNLNFLLEISDKFITDFSSTILDATIFNKPRLIIQKKLNFYYDWKMYKSTIFSNDFNKIINFLKKKDNPKDINLNKFNENFI